jgi:hypothetical protein
MAWKKEGKLHLRCVLIKSTNLIKNSFNLNRFQRNYILDNAAAERKEILQQILQFKQKNFRDDEGIKGEI